MADDDFLFDAILGFLRSPLWTTPIQTFIDEECIVFDGAEDSAHALAACHEKFRQVVDSVLSEHLSDLGISAEQFVGACDAGKNKELNALVSEYILALDDFLTFKKMMEKRNVELELEAMRDFANRAAGNAAPMPAAAGPTPEEEEAAMLEAAIAASIQDTDVASKEVEMEAAQLEHALAMSLQLEERRVAEEREKAAADTEKVEIEKKHEEEVKRVQESFQAEKAALSQQPAMAPPRPAAANIERPGTAQTPTLGSVQLHRHTTFGASKSVLPGIAGGKPAAAAAEAPKAAAAASGPSNDDLKKRQEYLKQQRERLLQARKAEREQELKDYKQQQGKPDATPKKEEVSEATKEMRLALANRFKDDLIQETRNAAAREKSG